MWLHPLRAACCWSNYLQTFCAPYFNEKMGITGGLLGASCWLSGEVSTRVQDTQVRSLIQEGFLHAAEQPEPACHNHWAWEPQLLKPAALEPCFVTTREASSVRSPHTSKKSNSQLLQLEKSSSSSGNPVQSKINKKQFFENVLPCKIIVRIKGDIAHKILRTVPGI